MKAQTFAQFKTEMQSAVTRVIDESTKSMAELPDTILNGVLTVLTAPGDKRPDEILAVSQLQGQFYDL